MENESPRIAVMVIQQDVNVERQVRMLVAGWPRTLRDAGTLCFKAVTAPTRFGPDAKSRLEARVGDALEAAEPGDVLVISLVEADLTLDLIERVARHWERTRRLTPEGEVDFAVAFRTDGSAMQARDLSFLWDRSWARAAVRPLALTLSEGLGEGAMTVSGPFRGTTVDYIRWLPELPVVSAEIVRLVESITRGGNTDKVPNYRWSNRIAALRSAGLIVPLSEREEMGGVRRAHAEAVGRPVDKRPTRLYRSVPYDLKRWAGYERSQRRG